MEITWNDLSIDFKAPDDSQSAIFTEVLRMPVDADTTCQWVTKNDYLQHMCIYSEENPTEVEFNGVKWPFIVLAMVQPRQSHFYDIPGWSRKGTRNTFRAPGCKADLFVVEVGGTQEEYLPLTYVPLVVQRRNNERLTLISVPVHHALLHDLDVSCYTEGDSLLLPIVNYSVMTSVGELVPAAWRSFQWNSPYSMSRRGNPVKSMPMFHVTEINLYVTWTQIAPPDARVAVMATITEISLGPTKNRE
jgi:hypothetical protein